MVKRILVPLDGSELAEAALDHAVSVATTFGAEIVLLRVVPAPSGMSRDALASSQSRMATAEAEAYLNRVSSALPPGGPPVETLVSVGWASDEILDAARRVDADFILLTSHGEGGHDRFETGGTMRLVLDAARASVMVIRAGHPRRTQEGIGHYRRILAPVDGSKRGEWALCLAASLAKAQGAELLVVHVLTPPEVMAVEGQDKHVGQSLGLQLEVHNRQVAEQYLKATCTSMCAPDLEVRPLLVEGRNVARALQETASKEGADLIVMSAHGRSPASGWSYGNQAYRVVTHGETDTIVLQDIPKVAGASGATSMSLRSRAGGARRHWTH